VRPETEAAIRAAGIAQRIADSRDGADQVTSKGGIDLATATDLACEDAIRAELTGAFPAYPVIGEERGGSPSVGTPYWLVDPICGTRAFASNVPLYCANIALVENGAVTVAAVGIGQTGEIVYAERGSGAWMRTASGERRIVPGEHSNTVWINGTTEHAPRSSAVPCCSIAGTSGSFRQPWLTSTWRPGASRAFSTSHRHRRSTLRRVASLPRKPARWSPT
jgi:myo-inositol-1(or 4)-monophosphatase